METVLLHEAGHVVGLSHSDDTSAVMYSTYHGWRRALQADYVNREWVSITVTVTDLNGESVSGAAVSVLLTTANGRLLSAQGTTNASGVLSSSYKVNANLDGSGTYTLDTTATNDAGSANGSTTFNVSG